MNEPMDETADKPIPEPARKPAHRPEPWFKRQANRVGRGLRIAGTGLSFFIFGVGGLLLRMLLFPLLDMTVRSRPLKIKLARELIRLSFRGFIELMRLLGVLRYDIRGLQHLRRNGLLILANHPTLIDTVFLMAFSRHADCIVKGALWNHPVTRGPVRSAAYISNDNGPALIGECIASLNNGNNLIIFPEGTRTATDGVMRFKRGAANVAVRGRRDITPVVIRCRPPTLAKGGKWWQVPPRKASFTITVQADIVIDDFLQNGVSDIHAARHLTDYLQNYFMKATLGHAAT
ncbi:MAG: 1-acyl-sn-glycerol-3-phosphate acyltransferase [Herbaspirillum sp.]|jgi:1-acyl-sn-glycerol-3-phosphate acyltransferase|nr:1-acyl-sn-glycerol-3-phosphate acyltransferase [Herbaspirillum sp.]